MEVSLSMEDGSEVQMDGLERTCDGKYKCSYCSYANKGMARLIEHIRIHTGQCLQSHCIYSTKLKGYLLCDVNEEVHLFPLEIFKFGRVIMCYFKLSEAQVCFEKCCTSKLYYYWNCIKKTMAG